MKAKGKATDVVGLLVALEELPMRWQHISESMETEKRRMMRESEQYLSLCAVQTTLERCAAELHTALDPWR